MIKGKVLKITEEYTARGPYLRKDGRKVVVIKSAIMNAYK